MLVFPVFHICTEKSPKAVQILICACFGYETLILKYLFNILLYNYYHIPIILSKTLIFLESRNFKTLSIRKAEKEIYWETEQDFKYLDVAT